MPAAVKGTAAPVRGFRPTSTSAKIPVGTRMSHSTASGPKSGDSCVGVAVMEVRTGTAMVAAGDGAVQFGAGWFRRGRQGASIRFVGPTFPRPEEGWREDHRLFTLHRERVGPFLFWSGDASDAFAVSDDSPLNRFRGSGAAPASRPDRSGTWFSPRDVSGGTQLGGFLRIRA
jgi:hypothetical protein